MADAILATEMACCTCKVVKPLDEFSKSKTGRFGRRLRCKECRSAENRVWREKNPDYRMAYYEANKEKELNHPKTEKRKSAKKVYYQKNKERLTAQSLKWAKDNPALATARTLRAMAAKIKATPLWADQKLIAAFYVEAKQRRTETGSDWHVDHIVPLRSKIVCGLHVQFNLQVITATENISKSNQRWPDMP